MDDQTLPIETVQWREKIGGLLGSISSKVERIDLKLEAVPTRAEVSEIVEDRVRRDLSDHRRICVLERTVEASTAKKTKSDPPPPVSGSGGGLLKDLEIPAAFRVALLIGVTAGGFLAGFLAGR